MVSGERFNKSILLGVGLRVAVINYIDMTARFYWKSTAGYNGETTVVERVEGGSWFADLRVWKVLDRHLESGLIVEHLEELPEGYMILPCWKQTPQEWKHIGENHWQIGEYEMLECPNGTAIVPTELGLTPEQVSTIQNALKRTIVCSVSEYPQPQGVPPSQTQLHSVSGMTTHTSGLRKGPKHNQIVSGRIQQRNEHPSGQAPAQPNRQSNTQYPRKSSSQPSKPRKHVESGCLIQM